MRRPPPSEPRRRAAARCAALVSLGCLLVAPAQPGGAQSSAPASVVGRVVVSQPMTSIEMLAPVVVYLENESGRPARPPAAVAEIHQKNARFSPAFSVVVAGQGVSMVNDDNIYHNVFSFSRPNDFDLGIYPAGKAKRVTFDHPGVVKTYCSIHEKMNGTIVVTPSPHYAVVGADGSFRIEGVPPGRYRLKSWCEKLPQTSRDIVLTAGRTLEVEIDLAQPGS